MSSYYINREAVLEEDYSVDDIPTKEDFEEKGLWQPLGHYDESILELLTSNHE